MNPAAKTMYNFAPDLDGDMIDTRNHWKKTENRLGKWNIANVQLESDPICSSAGCDQYKHPKKEGHPMDYFVPNFGRDHDMNHNDQSLDWAEKHLNHKWNWQKPDKKDGPPSYEIRPLDHDIQDSIGHMKAQEAKHGVWNLPKEEDVQLESDPICSSAGCSQYKHKKKELGYPINYPVPNNGRDRDDVLTTEHSLEIAEAQRKHTWDFKMEKPPLNPAKKTMYNFAPDLDEDMVSTRNHWK